MSHCTKQRPRPLFQSRGETSWLVGGFNQPMGSNLCASQIGSWNPIFGVKKKWNHLPGKFMDFVGLLHAPIYGLNMMNIRHFKRSNVPTWWTNIPTTNSTMLQNTIKTVVWTICSTYQLASQIYAIDLPPEGGVNSTRCCMTIVRSTRETLRKETWRHQSRVSRDAKALRIQKCPKISGFPLK